MFKDTSTYEYGRDFHFYMEPNKKQIMLIWVVADDLPDDQIGTYAEDLIKGFNDIVHTQDFSIEMSGEDSYGGLWKQYALSYSIVPESDQDNEDAWLSVVPMRLAQISNFRYQRADFQGERERSSRRVRYD